MGTLALIETLKPILQGAEAKVYKCYLHGQDFPPILLKHRFTKCYRHPSIDNNLTKGRVAGEARLLMKCLRNGVRVPGLRMVDAENGVLGIEWIEGKSLRIILSEAEEGLVEEGAKDEEDEGQDAGGILDLSKYGLSIDELMAQIGFQIAAMHISDVIHGDLTTSNMLLHTYISSLDGKPASEIVLIDFGLAFVSNLVEDKAVDLYVLERAFASTHPASEPWFNAVLQAYAQHSGKAWPVVLKRLDQVRLRGRKRAMVG